MTGGECAGAGGQAAGQVTRAQLVQDASRHRHRWEPPPTPPGFWDMGFMDSLVRAPAQAHTVPCYVAEPFILAPVVVSVHRTYCILKHGDATCIRPPPVDAC